MHPLEPVLRQTQFLTSAQKFSQCPEDSGREVAFAGRSNAGKSSALNRLTCQKSLARTSRTPGRTQLLNFFEVRPGHRLVDLPGYGYARVDMATRNQWQKELDGYLSRRQSLCGLMLMMDVRHPLKDFDRMLIDWGAQSGVPLHILLTKADKLSFGVAKNTLHQVQRTLADHPAALSMQLFSSTRGLGTEEAWTVLGDWLGLSEA